MYRKLLIFAYSSLVSLWEGTSTRSSFVRRKNISANRRCHFARAMSRRTASLKLAPIPKENSKKILKVKNSYSAILEMLLMEIIYTPSKIASRVCHKLGDRFQIYWNRFPICFSYHLLDTKLEIETQSVSEHNMPFVPERF